MVLLMLLLLSTIVILSHFLLKKVVVFFYNLFIMKDMLNKLLILRSSGIGPVKYRALLDEFGTDENVVDPTQEVTEP